MPGTGNTDNQAEGSGTKPPVVTPPPVISGVKITPLAFTIHVPDLRNGDVSQIQQAAPKASIASAFKWAYIPNLPAEESINAVEYIIRGTYAQIVSTLGATVTEAQRADAKKKAVVLASVRAGAAAAYRIQKVDMNVTEACTTGYTYLEGAKGAEGTIDRDSKSTTTGGKYTIAQGMEELTAAEVAAVGALVYLGMAVPVLQGVSLVNSGHHYLPTTKNIFAGMKRQALGLATADAKAYIDAMGEVFDDMAFHKACHPISPPVKRRWAKSKEIGVRLTFSGHGAAAVRLPALPSDAAVGKAGVALAMAAKPVIVGMGHTISIESGLALISALESAEEGMPEREAVDAIKSWAAAHSASLAFCAGIVQFVHESAAAGRNTLLAAYSVRKLVAEHPTRVAEGSAYARVAAEKTRADMRDGTFTDPAFML